MQRTLSQQLEYVKGIAMATGICSSFHGNIDMYRMLSKQLECVKMPLSNTHGNL